MEGTVAHFFSEYALDVTVGYVITHHVIQHDISDDSRQGGLLDLPSVVLHHLISYLIDPQDLLNFGLTHPLVIGFAKTFIFQYFLGYYKR